MNKKLLVLIIHGMGSQQNDFEEEMIPLLSARIEKINKKNVDQIFWLPIY
jgi:hypothetical protein